MTQTRLPNLIIAGVPKAGTTSLFNYLAQHPDISPSDKKETQYFNILRLNEATAPLETYTAFFSRWGTEQYALEATPGYFQGGRSVASAISQTLPQARVLISLREPSDRCWSYFRFWKSRGQIPEDMSFEVYLDQCEGVATESGRDFREIGAYFGLMGGCYATWLRDWYTELGQQLEIVYFDDLCTDASATVKKVCSWLAIDHTVVDTFSLTIENQTKLVRSRSAQKLVSIRLSSDACAAATTWPTAL
jgi:hypothetical protein